MNNPRGGAASWRLAASLARRELRGGAHGFWIFLACLWLGVMAIASVSSLSRSLEAGLEQDGRAGKIHFVGFDSSEKLVQGMRDGKLQGLALQNPFKMGYLGVKTAVAVLNGEEVSKRIPTRVITITPENLDTPEIQALIAPEVKASKQ